MRRYAVESILKLQLKYKRPKFTCDQQCFFGAVVRYTIKYISNFVVCTFMSIFFQQACKIHHTYYVPIRRIDLNY